jgi:methylmalonyl-CoA/ethylmalonyl-CoA epimerase
MNKPFLKPLHVGISIARMPEAISWYQEVLDFKLQWCKDFPELNTKIAFLKQGDFEIELFEHYQTIALPEERLFPKSDFQTQGTKHIAFETDDIETLFNSFRQKNVDVVFGPVESPPKDALFGFIRDNSGVLIEFIEKRK